MLLQAQPHLWTVEEYLNSNVPGRTELIEGVIYEVSPHNAPHRYAVTRLTKILQLSLGYDYIVGCQVPLAIDGWRGKNAPEIDVVVTRDVAYKRIPMAADAFVAVEISDTTLHDDLLKVRLYVLAGIPTFLVNIPHRRVESYPDEQSLFAPTLYGESSSVTIMSTSINVADLLLPSDEMTLA